MSELKTVTDYDGPHQSCDQTFLCVQESIWKHAH